MKAEELRQLINTLANHAQTDETLKNSPGWAALIFGALVANCRSTIEVLRHLEEDREERNRPQPNIGPR